MQFSFRVCCLWRQGPNPFGPELERERERAGITRQSPKQTNETWAGVNQAPKRVMPLRPSVRQERALNRSKSGVGGNFQTLLDSPEHSDGERGKGREKERAR